jgi:DnaJ family protein C protein 19
VPAALFLLAAGAILWGWATGRLKKYSYEDLEAACIFLLGLWLLPKMMLVGAALMAGALLWAAWRRQRTPPARAIPADEARRLLGVPADATLAEIRDAHRRLIAKVHPDAGGSDELAHRVNAARDTLVAEMNRRTPRAS